MTRYALEIVQLGAQQRMRLFGIFSAESDAEAISAMQSLTCLRHDQRHHVDLYRDAGTAQERKIWSGLHHVHAVRGALNLVTA